MMNLHQLSNHIAFSPLTHSVVLAANHGVGKSAVTSKFTKLIGKIYNTESVGFVDIRLSQNDVGDLKGVPKNYGGRTFFAPPFWLPIEKNAQEQIKAMIEHIGEVFADPNTPEYGILFLDEMNRASKEVLQCAFELVLDRRLGGIAIPPGWKVMAAINHDADIYQVFELDPALLDRFSFIEFKPTTEEWLEWGEEVDENGRTNIHLAVRRYITSFPDHLDPSKELIESATKSTAKIQSRRSWHKLSECLYSYEDRASIGAPDLTDPSNEDSLVLIGKSYVGSAQAVAFAGFVRDKFDVITPAKIFDKWNTKLEERIKQTCAENPFEIGMIVKQVVEESRKRMTGTEFSPEVKVGLSKFILSLAKEYVVDVFTSLMQDPDEKTSTAARDWYSKFCAEDELGVKARKAIASSLSRKKV